MPETIEEFLASLAQAKGDLGAQSRLAVEYELAERPIAERDRLRAALDAAAVLRWFDAASLGHVMARPEEEARRVVDELTTLTSVEELQRGDRPVHNVHESTRLAWRKQLALERSEYFKELSARAAAYFDDDVADAGRIERVYHLLAADAERGADALEELDRKFRTSGRPESHVLLGATLSELATPGVLEPAARTEVLLCLGGVRSGRGESSEVEDVAREALTLARMAGRAAAEAHALHLLGYALKALGRLDKALSALQECTTILQQLVSQVPTHAGWRLDLDVAQDDIAYAVAPILDSVALARQVVEYDPTNAERRMDLAIALREAGELFIAQGRLSEARSALDESLVAARHNAGLDASNAVYRVELAISLRLSGHLARIEGRTEDGLAALSQAVGILADLTAQDPTNMTWRRELEAVRRECGMLTYGASL